MAAPLDPEPSQPQQQRVSYRSLPHKTQLAILCLARLADPLAATSIQSYVFYQLKSFDSTASDATISTQAGLLISAKTVAQVCTGMFWGKLADSEVGGRKIVLFVGLISCCISYIGYGLARSFGAAVLWRVFGGALSSNVAITRCVVAELNPEKRYRARALLLLPLFANAGMLIGPLMGGLLVSNAKNDSPAQYAYLGPNLFAAAIYFVAALGVLIGLDETLESIRHSEKTELQRVWETVCRWISRQTSTNQTYKRVDDESPNASLIVEDGSASTIPKPRKSKRKLPFRRMWTWNVICTMLSHFVISGHLGTFQSIWAIFLSTPISDAKGRAFPIFFNGGLGMLPRDVGVAMSLLGAIGVLAQLFIYPLLQDRFGTITIWRRALLIFPLVYLLAPFPAYVASSPSLSDTTARALSWLAVGGIILLFITGRSGVTPATTLLITDCTPHPSVRATINTAGTVIGNLSRSIFPVSILTIFGRGLQVGVVGLGFWCLACLAALSYFASLWVNEGSNGKEIVLEDSSDEE